MDVYHGTWAPWTAYFINPSYQSVCLYVYSLLLLLGNGLVNTFLRQRIHATKEELLVAPFSVRFMSYQRRVCGSVFVSPSVNIFPRRLRIVRNFFFSAVLALSKNQALSYSQNFLFIYFLFVACSPHVVRCKSNADPSPCQKVTDPWYSVFHMSSCSY
jgi:hypothetical protein